MSIVLVRRQWNDWRIGEVEISKLEGFRWDDISGGVGAVAPYPLIHAYTSCENIEGEIGHSCRHGKRPHSIKVCIVKKDQDPEVWMKVLELAGPKPPKRK